MYKNILGLFTFWHSNQMLLVTCDVPNMDSRHQIVIITCVCLMIWYTQREINDVLTMNLACWSLDEWAKISRFLGGLFFNLTFVWFFQGKKKSIIKILHDYYSKSHTLKNVRTTLIIYRRDRKGQCMTGQFTEDDAKVSSGRPARSRDDSISAKQGESDIEYDVSE